MKAPIPPPPRPTPRKIPRPEPVPAADIPAATRPRRPAPLRLLERGLIVLAGLAVLLLGVTYLLRDQPRVQRILAQINGTLIWEVRERLDAKSGREVREAFTTRAIDGGGKMEIAAECDAASITFTFDYLAGKYDTASMVRNDNRVEVQSRLDDSAPVTALSESQYPNRATLYFVDPLRLREILSGADRNADPDRNLVGGMFTVFALPFMQLHAVGGVRDLLLAQRLRAELPLTDGRRPELEILPRDEGFERYLRDCPVVNELRGRIRDEWVQAGNEAHGRHDYAEAMELYRRAASQGDGQAMRDIGILYKRGLGVPADLLQALTWFQAGAAANNADAQYELGLLFGNGEGVERDYGAAMRWFRRAAEQGQAAARFNIGAMYVAGLGVVRDYHEALGWLTRAADQGLTESQYALGLLHANGQGTPRDDREAMHWFRLAAEGGYLPAMTAIGAAYQTGRGVAVDYPQAMQWFFKAANAGDAEAQWRIGMALAEGLGPKQDYTEAARWFRMAAEQSYAPAEMNLGFILEKGLGTPAEPVEAALWMRRAAEQGEVGAMTELGVMYAKGWGVAKDCALARPWFEKALLADGESARNWLQPNPDCP